jgi:succinoglycan biosynthesis transport protein ExoP
MAIDPNGNEMISAGNGNESNGSGLTTLASRSGPQQIVIAKPSSKEPDGASTAPVLALLSAVRRRWKLAMPLGLILSVAAAGAAWKIFVPEYTASALLQLDSENRPVIFETADRPTNFKFDVYKNTQMQLMKAPMVVSAALRDNAELNNLPEIKAQPDPVAWLREGLKVSFPQNGELMEVAFATESADACKKIVGAVVEAYMAEVADKKRIERLTRTQDLETIRIEAEENVKKKREELKNVASTLGMNDSESLSVAQQGVVNLYTQMQGKLAEVQFELMQAEGEKQIIDQMLQNAQEQRADSETDRDGELQQQQSTQALLAESSPEVTRLEDDVASLSSRLEAMKINSGPAHPTVKRMEQELAFAQNMLEKRRKDAVTRAELMGTLPQDLRRVGGINPSVSGFDVELEARIGALRGQEKLLQAKVDQLEAETRSLGQSSVEVEMRRAELNYLEEVLQGIGEELERTRVELKSTERISRLGEATATAPDPKKRLLRTAALGLAGLFGPLALLVVWDLSRKQVDNADVVCTSLSLSSLGTIPIVSRRQLQGTAKSKRDGRERAELDEAVDSVASMILHRAEAEDRQVFMVSSAVPGEGKSTVACQVSKSLARSGKKIALLDFDLRRPSIDTYMNCKPEPGVSEVLSQQVSWQEAMQTTDYDRLSVLTAGVTDGNLNERCANGAVEELIASLRASFDLVIVDACPVLPVADARLVARYTDGVILSLVRDVSRLPLAARAVELLRSYGVSVLGTIVIGGKSNAYPTYYDSSNYSDKKKRNRLSDEELGRPAPK